MSAFAPISAPTRCPWGEKAFAAYLGSDRQAWAAHDSCELIRVHGEHPPLLVDQGSADNFLATQLNTPALMPVSAMVVSTARLCSL